MTDATVNLNLAIKKIVENYTKNMNLCDLVYGSYTGNGIKIDNKPVAIPLDMVDVPKALKTDNVINLKSGERIAIMQKQGCQRYYILDRL